MPTTTLVIKNHCAAGGLNDTTIDSVAGDGETDGATGCAVTGTLTFAPSTANNTNSSTIGFVFSQGTLAPGASLKIVMPAITRASNDTVTAVVFIQIAASNFSGDAKVNIGGEFPPNSVVAISGNTMELTIAPNTPTFDLSGFIAGADVEVRLEGNTMVLSLKRTTAEKKFAAASTDITSIVGLNSESYFGEGSVFSFSGNTITLEAEQTDVVELVRAAGLNCSGCTVDFNNNAITANTFDKAIVVSTSAALPAVNSITVNVKDNNINADFKAADTFLLVDLYGADQALNVERNTFVGANGSNVAPLFKSVANTALKTTVTGNTLTSTSAAALALYIDAMPAGSTLLVSDNTLSSGAQTINSATVPFFALKGSLSTDATVNIEFRNNNAVQSAADASVKFLSFDVSSSNNANVLLCSNSLNGVELDESNLSGKIENVANLASQSECNPTTTEETTTEADTTTADVTTLAEVTTADTTTTEDVTSSTTPTPTTRVTNPFIDGASAASTSAAFALVALVAFIGLF